MSTSMFLQSVSGSGFSGSTGILADNARAQETERRFSALIDGIAAGLDEPKTAASPSVPSGQDTRLPGDYISSFSITNPSENDYQAAPSGAAANSGQTGKIDKTSKLYEQALELESYFVKIMLSSMRNTITKTNLFGGSDFASKMYEDMMYDELSRTVTKNAGFGLADQVYLQLAETVSE
ncbi:rod-binding protein [Brucepastera parasyntrophica]|uniref:rod-binding protein n=1 Tax=Brucepastera parasyntrophica TaxID=2880008 RepID=UPI00210E673D|nr:rod-binding protein [Brucepastera parasyntrophica]ULQ60071.1 rod-binding protein [Brucepastera parasyntrophica]